MTFPIRVRVNEDNLQRTCNHVRKQLRPKEPTSLSTFQVDEDYLNASFQEVFHRETVTVKDRHHVILATKRQLDLLTNAKTWYVDGTFRVIRQPFTQLYPFHAFVKLDENVKQLPPLFVIMSGRRRKDYRKVLKAILCLIPDHRVGTIVADFEASICQAVRDVHPDVNMKGCAFHFEQALYRKITDKGLKVAYERRDVLCSVSTSRR